MQPPAGPSDARPAPEMTPGRVCLVYAVLGVAWITFSDAALGALIPDPVTLARAQTLKGWLFVAGSTALIWELVRRGVASARGADAARARMELRLQQAQKMEAVGMLAGGIAHDFNNVLAVIRTSAELLREALPDDDVRRPDADAIVHAATRGAMLTRQLLAFARRHTLEPRPVRVGDVVMQLRPMLARLIGNGVRIETDLVPDVEETVIDPHQLEQVLLNLVVNARDAMEGREGVVRIRTRVVGADGSRPQDDVYGHPLPEGRYVVIDVDDNGCGMSAEVLARLEEPFFTTKAPGHGTGLGLSTVRGIVGQAGGVVRVRSEVGRGSTFSVYLPVRDDAA